MRPTYRAIQLKGRGGLDQLQEVEFPLEPPKQGEVRIRVRASGVGSTDILKRTGYYLFSPPFPFVEGYEVLGDMDAIGPGVAGFVRGQRVCALTVYGGWAEYFTRGAEHFVPVPEGLDDAEAIALTFNYVTAYQMIHRTAAMQPGQTALVTGANGGIGTALLELLRVHGVRAFGLGSKKHFDLIRSLGGEPIESRTKPVDVALREVLPGGADVTFDGLGGAGTRECIRATRKGGLVAGYGFVAARGTIGMLRGFAALFLGARFAGRRGAFYGITALYRKDKRPFKEDLRKLFELLAARKIQPRIAARLPLLAGREGERLLEAGGLAGKIVLLSDLPS
ncbi:MAG: zinc-binding dehydrogenase [Acidobacteriia bacterium]|nr:zinc-binding dehydrogenase [Terriglobia bacterium]